MRADKTGPAHLYWASISYITENTARLHYKDGQGNAVHRTHKYAL